MAGVVLSLDPKPIKVHIQSLVPGPDDMNGSVDARNRSVVSAGY
jgi:hypothetical protein